MPVLGVGGVVKLIREAPDAVVLPSSALQSSYNSIYVRNPEYWSGDEVQIFSSVGLPLDTASDGPDCPDGHAMYQGSDWYLGSNRSHIAHNNDVFYDATEGDPFYMREEECGLTTNKTFYIYRDQLDRISFYTSRAAALAGSLNGRVPLFNVDYGSLVMTPTGTAEYQNAIADCVAYLGEYLYSDIQDEVTLQSICKYAPTYIQPFAGTSEYDNMDIAPRYYIDNQDETGALWLVQCDLQSWILNLSAPEVDTTAVGEKYGEAVKSIVNGGGTFDFLVDRNASESEHDSTALMRLLLLTEKGCKAKAQFWMISNSEAGMLPGQLYYETSVLVTSSAINVRADDVIAGSADFVTVGEIALKMGTN
jgi:hypothetical protein